MDLESLNRKVAGAALILYDPQATLWVVWRGADTVEVYDAQGANVRTWRVPRATKTRVRRDIERRIRENKLVGGP